MMQYSRSCMRLSAKETVISYVNDAALDLIWFDLNLKTFWNSSAFFQENFLEIAVCKMLAILLTPQFVNHYLFAKEAEHAIFL